MKINVALVTALAVFVSLFGCTDAPNAVIDDESSTAVNKFDNIPQTITVPYKAVLSPLLINDTLYMAVSEEDRSETDTNRLVSYNIETCEEEILFTSSQELANIQCLQGDQNWLVFADMALYGDNTNIYVMNINTRKFVCIYQTESSRSYYAIPTYMDGSVYWVEQDFDDESGVISVYNCNEKSKETLATVKNVSTGNLRISAADGKVVWFDSGNYYLFDTVSEETQIIMAHNNDAMNVCYSNGYIFANETENFMQQTPKKLVCIDTATEEYSEFSWTLQRFIIGSEYFAGSTGSILRFFRINGNRIFEIKELSNTTAMDMTASHNDTFITVEKNAGMNENPFSGLKNETVLNIYRLG